MSVFKGFARVELFVPFEVEVDDEEFADWLGSETATDDRRAEYIKSSPDWWADIDIEEPSWRHEVTDYDIEQVTAGG